MRNINALIPVLVGMFALLSEGAQAACTYVGTGKNTEVNFNFGNITVQRDAPVGTELAKRSYLTPGYGVTCTTRWHYNNTLTRFTTLSAYGNHTYDTNIDGIGLTLYFGAGLQRYFPYKSQDLNPVTAATGGTVIATLVKTAAGAVGSGRISTGRVANHSYDKLSVFNVNLTGVNTITPVACSVTQTAISVPMGDVLRSEFTGVGSVATSKAFSIPLNCDENTRVKITLDATADSSGIPGVIALNPSTSDKVASGVGVQVLRNSTPVTLGSALQVGTVATSGVYTIPLAARYYQTQARVTAGQANATATFTMTYN
ncbi:fimbrial protein [Candidatus Pantoea multigeneris]|uniref:Fimbrial protein n=1 Tax=Candidatus Pantoea multigeneris TaxID=2608357 RepID=A0ABX0RA91_9GAMM|nr:fimbrial protein [Pantoea multigeneris]NIF20384.1 fimbrial protein [Pantoea multigeneris]